MIERTSQHSLGCKHTIYNHQQHLNWDNSRAPAITIAPGDTSELRDIDATCGQLTAQSTVDDIRALDFARINPIAGPVYVDGAAPGDTLKVTLLGFQPFG